MKILNYKKKNREIPKEITDPEIPDLGNDNYVEIRELQIRILSIIENKCSNCKLCWVVITKLTNISGNYGSGNS